MSMGALNVQLLADQCCDRTQIPMSQFNLWNHICKYVYMYIHIYIYIYIHKSTSYLPQALLFSRTTSSVGKHAYILCFRHLQITTIIMLKTFFAAYAFWGIRNTCTHLYTTAFVFCRRRSPKHRPNSCKIKRIRLRFLV